MIVYGDVSGMECPMQSASGGRVSLGGRAGALGESGQSWWFYVVIGLLAYMLLKGEVQDWRKR